MLLHISKTDGVAQNEWQRKRWKLRERAIESDGRASKRARVRNRESELQLSKPRKEQIFTSNIFQPFISSVLITVRVWSLVSFLPLNLHIWLDIFLKTNQLQLEFRAKYPFQFLSKHFKVSHFNFRQIYFDFFFHFSVRLMIAYVMDSFFWGVIFNQKRKKNLFFKWIQSNYSYVFNVWILHWREKLKGYSVILLKFVRWKPAMDWEKNEIDFNFGGNEWMW